MHPPDLPGPVRVLLVEDNEGDIFLISAALRHPSFPHELTVMRDGSEAQHLLQAKTLNGHSPELILLDLKLPCVDGVTVLALLRDHPTLRTVPVVVLTSTPLANHGAEVAKLAHGLFLTKPSDYDAYMDIGQQIRAFWEHTAAKVSAARSGG